MKILGVVPPLVALPMVVPPFSAKPVLIFKFDFGLIGHSILPCSSSDSELSLVEFGGVSRSILFLKCVLLIMTR
jgi:hypothetical protein